MTHARITDTLVNRLAPKQAKYIYRDAVVPGFGVVVHPSGKKAYRVEAHLNGNGQAVSKTFANVEIMEAEEAREIAKKLLLSIKAGVHPKHLNHISTSRTASYTLRKVLDDFLQDRPLKERTQKAYRYQIERSFKDWLDRPLATIHKDEVREWYVAGKETPADTDNSFRTLRSVLNYAKAREIIEHNPCDVIGSLQLGYRKNRRNSSISVDKELPQFIRALVDYKPVRKSQVTAKDFLVLVLHTGYRSGEARHLRWRDVDLDRYVATIPDPKNHVPHNLPLTSLLWTLFVTRLHEVPQEQRESGAYLDQYVFLNRKGTGPLTDVRKTLRTICKDAKIPEYTVHDLRRTFASVLNYLSIGYADVKTLLNHKTKDITETYVQPQRLADQLQSVADFYEAMYIGKPLAKVQRDRQMWPHDRSRVEKMLFSERLHGPDAVWTEEEAREAYKALAEEIEDGEDVPMPDFKLGGSSADN